MESIVLGRTLEDARRILRAQGVEPDILTIRAPRANETEGTLRVVRAQEGGRHLTVALFPDGMREDSL